MEFLYWQCMPEYVNTCQLICNMLCFRHSAYVVKADIIAFDYMADVIGHIFICHIVAYRADVRPIYYYITQADGIALDVCVGRCYCQLYCHTRYANYSGKADVIA